LRRWRSPVRAEKICSKNSKEIKEILRIHREIEEEIEKRLREFTLLWRKGDDREIFKEFVFCILTPQSKAKICWRVVEEMDSSGVLYYGNEEEIERFLYGVRFKHTKAKRIVKARKKFYRDGKFLIKYELSKMKSAEDMRDYLVKEVEGYGYKEASHFLRNISLGLNLAILDRHILKNLKKLGVIENISGSLSRRSYLDIERKMRDFAEEIGIPMAHLDFVLWYRETGEVFK